LVLSCLSDWHLGWQEWHNETPPSPFVVPPEGQMQR